MAKLNSQLLNFAAAATAVTAATSRKLIRNFSYYRNSPDKTVAVCQADLLDLCHHIRMDAFGLHNLLENPNNRHSAFLVPLAGEINDSFEELHRKLLFFDVELIADIIPDIDLERNFWAGHLNDEFYGDELSRHLETCLPDTVLKLEKTISTLPEEAYL